MSDRGYVYQPLKKNLRFKNKCQILAMPAGEKFYSSLGDHSGVTMSYTIEETEVYSNESPDKDLAVLDITKAEPTLSMVLRQVTDYAKQIMYLTAKPVPGVAVPVVDRPFEFVGMVPGNVAKLGVRGVTEVKITTPGFVEGTHFMVDREAGRLELIKVPDGYVPADGIEGTVSGAGTALPTYGLMDRTQIRASILIRTNNLWGPNWEVELWDVQLRPDGELSLGQDGDEFGSITVNGRLFPDPTQPQAFRFGQMREIAAREIA